MRNASEPVEPSKEDDPAVTATREARTNSGMVQTFVTAQPIVCDRCGTQATHGAAIVDSRCEYPEHDYPIYRAMFFCAEHAHLDWYRWPALELVTPIEFGRNRVTVGELKTDQ